MTSKGLLGGPNTPDPLYIFKFYIDFSISDSCSEYTKGPGMESKLLRSLQETVWGSNCIIYMTSFLNIKILFYVLWCVAFYPYHIQTMYVAGGLPGVWSYHIQHHTCHHPRGHRDWTKKHEVDFGCRLGCEINFWRFRGNRIKIERDVQGFMFQARVTYIY